MTATNRTPWTAAENLALSRLYFDMLDSAVNGYPYNKAQLIRERQGKAPQPGPLFNRSRGSIEAKLMNATACHRDLGHEAAGSAGSSVVTMDGYGYRALPNYQKALKDAMRAELHRRAGLALLPDSHPAQVSR